VESTSPRVALVHDFLIDLRGAERVFAALCDIWPKADLFTTIYDADATQHRFDGRNIRTSFLNRLHLSARTFRNLLPLYPAAIESFDFSGYDLVVSSSSAWAHAVLVDEGTTHVCYCHNPFRYAWNDRERTLARHKNPVTKAFLAGTFRRWRQWDWIAAQRTDRYVANSRATQSRIRAYFGRESKVVHPPVETGRFQPGTPKDHYAIVSELMPHKQIEDAILAFNSLRRPLVVVGDGPSARHLHRISNANVRFTGRVSDSAVAEILSTARAMIVPSIEEFGIAAVECQAAGRPVIARRGGGALETIEEGVTGGLWAGGPDELALAVVEFDDAAIDPQRCVQNAARFNQDAFRQAMLAEIAAARDGEWRPKAADARWPRTPRLRATA
jgi:glycosyltransferase involved in cell wall biosynthesis